MQRARLFTLGTEGFPVCLPRAERLWVPALLLALVVGAAAVILQNPKVAIWDQARLLEARFEAPYHPAPPFGFTSQLLVIGLRAASPWGAEHLHEVLRVVAMAFWAGAATLLASALLARRALVALLVALLFTSQYPFLWLSSELVTGGFLCLALWAWTASAAPWVVGALLALLALCKIELVLVSAALAAFWAHRAASRDEARVLLGSFAGALLLLLLPGLVTMGPGYLLDYGGAPGGRTFATFSQHFAALVAPFQIAPDATNPWNEPQVYVQRVFPGARSMSGVLGAAGLPYLDFVALSLARGLRKAGWVFHWGWLVVPVLLCARRLGVAAPSDREKALLLTFVGCVPFVLLSYPHIRYFARYYPVFWILVFAALERVIRMENAAARGPCLRIAGLFVALAFAQSALRASAGLASAPHVAQYWFSD